MWPILSLICNLTNPLNTVYACACKCVCSLITCKHPDECKKKKLLSSIKKLFSVPQSGFSSVPKHSLMEHDSSLVPR